MRPADRVREALLEVEVSSEQLRRDRSGRSWLPSAIWALVESDAVARAAVAEFVEMELAMYGDAVGPCDPLFTARVMRAVPEIERADANRRNLILAAAHALAVGVAYLVLWPWYETGQLQPWVHDAQRWLDSGVETAGFAGLLVAATLAVVAVMLALLPRSESGPLRREA